MAHSLHYSPTCLRAKEKAPAAETAEAQVKDPDKHYAKDQA
jgi:hypothetical protein